MVEERQRRPVGFPVVTVMGRACVPVPVFGLSLFPLEQVNSLTAESSATSHCTALPLGVMVARSMIGCIQGSR